MKPKFFMTERERSAADWTERARILRRNIAQREETLNALVHVREETKDRIRNAITEERKQAEYAEERAASLRKEP